VLAGFENVVVLSSFPDASLALLISSAVVIAIIVRRQII
jgi:hypothetical protein